MNASQNLSHPEIEFRPSFLTYLPAPSPARATLLDLLEVYADRIILKPKLDHSSLIDYFSVSTCSLPAPGRLRADSICRNKMPRRSRTIPSLSDYCVWCFSSLSWETTLSNTRTHSFVEELNFVDPFHLQNEPNLELNTTGYWMRQRFGVTPLFFSLILSQNYVVKPGNALLMRMENGKCVAVGEYCARSSLHPNWF